MTCERVHPAGRERTHGICEAEGTDYDAIEKTVTFTFDVGPDGERVEQTLASLRELADLGVQVAHGRVEAVHEITPLTIIGERVVPAVAAW